MAGRLSVGAVLSLRDEMSAKLDRARSSARRFVDQIHSGSARVDKFTTSVTQAGVGMVRHFGERMGAMIDRFFTKLKFGAMIAGAAIGALAFKAVNDAMKFEKTLRDSTALLAGTGATAQETDAIFKQWGEGIEKLAPALAKPPQDLANAMYDIVSAGFTGQEALTVLEAAGKGASAGFTDTQTVVKGLVGTLRAYGFEADQAKRVTDVMFQAVNVGQLTFEEFSQGIGDVVGIASIAHVSIEEIGAAIAEMTKRGITAPEAFTSLNRVMISLISKTPAVEDAMKQLGLSDKDWGAQALAANGLTGELHKLLDVLKPSAEDLQMLQSSSSDVVDAAVAKIAGDKIDALSSLFGDIRGLRGALVLAADSGYTFDDAMRDMVGSAGAVDRAFAEQEKSSSRAKDRLMSYIDVLKLQLAGALLPSLADAFSKVGGFIQREILDNPVFQTGTLGDKLGVIGSALGQAFQNLVTVGIPAAGELGSHIWLAVTGWWHEHEDIVKKDLHDFFNWLGDTAIPWALDAAAKIAAEFAPALLTAIGGIVSSPTGLATVLIAGGLKLGALDALGKGTASAEQAAAATGLEAAAVQLQAAAGALMQAAGAEGVAAGELGAGGAAGAISKSAGSWFFAAGVIPTIATLALTAGTVYFAAKTFFDTRSTVQGQADVLGQTTTQALDTGNFTGVSSTLQAANAQKAGQNWAADFSGAIGNAIFGVSNPDDLIKGKVLDYFNKVAAGAVDAGDPNAMANAINKLKTSGIWDQLGQSIQDAIGMTLSGATTQIRGSHAVDQAQSLLAAGFDLSPAIGEYAKQLSGLPWDQQREALRKIMANDPKGFADAMATLTEKTLEHQSDLQKQGDYYHALGNQLANVNPALSTMYQQLASMYYGMSNWVPPGWISTLPSSNGAGSGINPWAIAGAVGPNGEIIGGTPVPVPPTSTGVSRISKTHPFAKGGFGSLTKATMLEAGEAGQEDYAFIPKSRGGIDALLGAGAGTRVEVRGPLIAQAVIREEADIAKIAERLAFELEKRAGNASRGASGQHV